MSNEYDQSRISSLSLEGWREELKIGKTTVKILVEFEDYLKELFRFYGPHLKPQFDIYVLREYINKICEELDFDKQSFINIFNQFFRYELEDTKMMHRGYFRRYCNLNMNGATESQIDCVDQDRPKYNYQLSFENVENIILRFHLYRGQSKIKDRVDLHLPSSRKISSSDFKDLCIQLMSTQELLQVIRKQYYYLTDDYPMIYKEYITRIEQQDKYYFIEYHRTGIKKISQDVRLFDSPTFNLYQELQTQKTLINQPVFSRLVNSLCNEIKEELDLIRVIIRFDMLIDRDFWEEAKSLLLDTPFTIYQSCLLIQVLNGTLDIDLVRYTERFRQLINEILARLKEKSMDCFDFESPTIPACNHRTFHYYTMHKWILALNKIFRRKGILKPKDKFVTIDTKKSMPILITDPKNGFCNKCYHSYNRLKNIRINMTNINSQAPRELFYVLFKYKNKMPIYRLRFSDHCDIPSELKEDTNHYNEYVSSFEGSVNIQQELIKAISKDIFVLSS